MNQQVSRDLPTDLPDLQELATLAADMVDHLPVDLAVQRGAPPTVIMRDAQGAGLIDMTTDPQEGDGDERFIPFDRYCRDAMNAVPALLAEVARLRAGRFEAKSEPYSEALLRLAVVARDVRAALVPAVSEPEWAHHRLADSFVRQLCAALDALDGAQARRNEAKPDLAPVDRAKHWRAFLEAWFVDRTPLDPDAPDALQALAEDISVHERDERRSSKASPACRKCSECDGDHHFIETGAYVCKHCELLAEGCEACDATGAVDGDVDGDEVCEECEGRGVILPVLSRPEAKPDPREMVHRLRTCEDVCRNEVADLMKRRSDPHGPAGLALTRAEAKQEAYADAADFVERWVRSVSEDLPGPAFDADHWREMDREDVESGWNDALRRESAKK